MDSSNAMLFMFAAIAFVIYGKWSKKMQVNSIPAANVDPELKKKAKDSGSDNGLLMDQIHGDSSKTVTNSNQSVYYES